MKTGFTFYHSGRDYFYPCPDRTYRTKAIAANILTALGYTVNESTVDYLQKRMSRATMERKTVHGNPWISITEIEHRFSTFGPDDGSFVILN